MNRERILHIFRKELRQAFREPRMRAMLIVPPLVQLLVFGYAVNMDVEHARIAWMDRDDTPASREMRDAFAGSTYFEIVKFPTTETEAGLFLDRGEVQAIIRVLPGFGANLRRGESAQVQVLVDGTNSNTASLVAAYASSVSSRYSSVWLDRWQRERLLARGVAEPVTLRIPAVEGATRVWFNPDLTSRNYFVPGVIVNILSLVTIMLTAMAIVREKEIGTLEQLMVTPIRPMELILGKTLPFAMVGLVNMTMVTVAALLVFRVPFRGSFLFLAGSTLLFLLSTLGIGLFISTISETQQQAMLSANIFILPAFMLSGFAFPIRNMPDIAQWFTYLNPMRYFMEITRGVFLKGVGIETLWPQLMALAIFGIAIVTLSASRFRKRLD
jgi:ABC-2 type transport system permease protein